MMRQEQLGQVVAHHPRLVTHGVIDARANAVDEQGPGPGDQARETGQGQRDQGQAREEVAASWRHRSEETPGLRFRLT